MAPGMIRVMDSDGTLDPMGFTGLLDTLAAWVAHHRAALDQRGWTLAHRDDRKFGKWCGTVEMEAPQRVGYLSVWSSGELDCQVQRSADFFVLNEHRLVQSDRELESVLATFLEVVGYEDPRESSMLNAASR